MPDYPQAEPPGPLTCAMFFIVALFFMAAVIWILAKGAGVI